MGWLGTAALGYSGGVSMLFAVSAISAHQGGAALFILMLGVLLACAAVPGWLELVLMKRDGVGGIAAACSEAFTPYAPVLSALAGSCYWFGWTAAAGIPILLTSGLLHEWYLPHIPVRILAGSI